MQIQIQIRYFVSCISWEDLKICRRPPLLGSSRVQQWRWRWRLFKSKPVGSKVHRNTGTVIFGVFMFFAVPLWDFRNAGTFPQNLHYPQNHLCILSLFMGCWNIQKKMDSDLSWAGDGRFCGDFPPFFVLTPPREETCQKQKFWGEKKWRRIFWAHETLAILSPEKLQGFHGTLLCIPLLHPILFCISRDPEIS